MRKRWLLVALALVAVSCDATAGTTTTTEDSTTTTEAVAVGRVPLEPNGAALATLGDRGAYVEALQFYLVCVGLGQPDAERPAVSVDGNFGPITAFATAYYQAQLRKVPSGAPDDVTFTSMARECSDVRTLLIPLGESSVEIAGNAAPGDDELFHFDGLNGQILRLTAIDGTVAIAVENSAGEAIASGSGSVDAELPGAGSYRIRFTADSATTYRAIAEARSPNLLVSEFGPMVLGGDGTAVAEFGGDATNAVAVMGLILGVPSRDSGWTEDPAGCPGTHRSVIWLVQAGLGSEQHPAVFIAYFAEVSGVPTFLEYAYFTLDLLALDPLAQGLGTVGAISIGSTLTQFSEAYPDDTVSAQGLVSVDDGVAITFLVSGGSGTPDPELSRVRRIEAGSGGCDTL